MKARLNEEGIAMRLAREFFNGAVVNLGYGLPALAANFIPGDIAVMLQSENGALGLGSVLASPPFDWDLVNASGQPVSASNGISFFHQADSFAMIRGGHVDIAALGALQVSETGDLANWTAGKRRATGPGGALDLAVSAKKVIVAMPHTTKDGKLKIVKNCTYPLTGKNVVNTIITDVAVMEVTPLGLELKEVVPGFSIEEIQAITEPELLTHNVKEMEL